MYEFFILKFFMIIILLRWTISKQLYVSNFVFVIILLSINISSLCHFVCFTVFVFGKLFHLCVILIDVLKFCTSKYYFPVRTTFSILIMATTDY